MALRLRQAAKVQRQRLEVFQPTCQLTVGISLNLLGFSMGLLQ